MSMPTPEPFVRRNRHNQPRQTQDDVQVTHPRTTHPGPAHRQSIDTDAVHTDEYAQEATNYDDPSVITLPPLREKRPQESRKTRPQPAPAPRKRKQTQKQAQAQNLQFHWLLYFGVGMLLMLGLYIGGYQLWNSARNIYDNWTYGTPRTYQLDAVVGDHDSASSPTHFIALNLHGTVDVIELPGGDITHAKVYPGPHLLWSQADQAVVTLGFLRNLADAKCDILKD